MSRLNPGTDGPRVRRHDVATYPGTDGPNPGTDLGRNGSGPTTTAATQLADAFATSIATSPGNRITSVAPSDTIEAGTSDSASSPGLAANRFFHQYSRDAVIPCLRA